MKVQQEKWTVKKLVEQQDEINLNPIWQRGPAWKAPRQVLLIDSILREMDIPKIYLRKQRPGSAYSFDAVDGQQRLRAIYAFRNNELALNYAEKLLEIDGQDVNGNIFRELPKTLRDRFTEFEVSIAKIVQGETDEITNLFSRLQMGVSLNPAELRNAMQGPILHVVNLLALEHPFFQNCRISAERYKRQDYITHVMAMAAYGVTRDIKAPDLKKFVNEYNKDDAEKVHVLMQCVGEALNVLTEVNEILGYSIFQKWIFVDLCWWIMKRQAVRGVVDPRKLARRFAAFDDLRRAYTRNPEQAIEDSHGQKGSNLYQYIVAFKAQGGTKEHLAIRANSLDVFFARI